MKRKKPVPFGAGFFRLTLLDARLNSGLCQVDLDRDDVDGTTALFGMTE